MTTMRRYLQHFQITSLMVIIHYKIHGFTIQDQTTIYAIQVCIIIFLIINKFVQRISFSMKQQC